MPFKSKAQQRYLYAKEPAVAKEFASEMKKSDYVKLPAKVESLSTSMSKKLKGK